MKYKQLKALQKKKIITGDNFFEEKNRRAGEGMQEKGYEENTWRENT